jgi:hypothetical protein
MKKTKHFISAGVFAFFLFLAFGSMDDDKKNVANPDISTASGENPDKGMTSEKSEILEKLKAKAKKDWPNDYTTQEFWVKEQLEAYDDMLTIPDDALKQKAQQDWPLDFVTQKFWYNEQIQAKERIK